MGLDKITKKVTRSGEKAVLKTRKWWQDTGKDATIQAGVVVKDTAIDRAKKASTLAKDTALKTKAGQHVQNVGLKQASKDAYSGYVEPLVKAGYEKGKEHISRIGDEDAQLLKQKTGRVPKQGELKGERNAKLGALISDPAHPLNDIGDIRSDTDFHAVRGKTVATNPHLQAHHYDMESDGTPYGTPVSKLNHFMPSDITDTSVAPEFYFTTLEQLKVYMGRVLLRTPVSSAPHTVAQLDTQLGNHSGYNRVLDTFTKREGTAKELQRHEDLSALRTLERSVNDSVKVPQYYAEMSATEVQMLMGITKMPNKPRSLWWRLLHTLNK